MTKVTIIGAGLAGCEAALVLSRLGHEVRLIEAKPKMRSPAHHSDGFAEVVCSNSFKSDEPFSASGILKAELRRLDSPLLTVADEVKVPSGTALAVDRERFSDRVTELISSDPHIETVSEVVDEIDFSLPTIIATGPLTLSPLSEFLSEKLCGNLYFYDAAAPIVSADSVDYNKAFGAGRYDRGDGYINCPLSRDEYYAFIGELISAERVIVKDFEKGEIFEGCMPIEVMARRGVDTLRFGPLKPVGMVDPVTGEMPFAVVQLRKENAEGNMLNMVGFQTNLKFGEQKRVFGMIPALKNAEFLRYGVMHKNIYIDAPKVLSRCLELKAHSGVFVAGQLSGVEGYVESIAAGHMAAFNMDRFLRGKELMPFPHETMLGALSVYLARTNENFQPMNANLGLLPPLREKVVGKENRQKALSQRSISKLDEFIDLAKNR